MLACLSQEYTLLPLFLLKASCGVTGVKNRGSRLCLTAFLQNRSGGAKTYGLVSSRGPLVSICAQRRKLRENKCAPGVWVMRWRQNLTGSFFSSTGLSRIEK